MAKMADKYLKVDPWAIIEEDFDPEQYVGDLYIGGTHPAANGGAWMAAVLGFAGLNYDGWTVHIKPSLPKHWQSVELPVTLRGDTFKLRISKDEVTVITAADYSGTLVFSVQGREGNSCSAGETLRLALTETTV
ncbi:glycosyl hydrolase family 65 protein [Paenibacillus sp. FSL K6-0276]|uniref:glycosyl hydrolase family 65 protein n=1 Tax=unclassified Paenibacillus TaxID=185978 RepID=UPI0028A5848B|nr:glycosyl hydrolase family 65 protein [Paenibacillus sp.]